MNKDLHTFAVLSVLALLTCGCGKSIAPPTSDVEPPIASTTETPQGDETAASDAAPDSEAEPEEEFDVKRAGVGATGKGNYGVTSEQPMSIVTTPVSVYFQAQERSVFDMQIPHAMNLFQATEGRFPNSEEEFMEKIIKANMIVLPKLPEGDSYFYDPATHTLMIRSRKS